MPFCSKCGKKVPEDASFCPLCGYNLKQVTTEKPIPFEFKKCPHCGGEMVKGYINTAWYPIDTSTKILGVLSPTRKRLFAYLCNSCGYIMLRSREH